MLNEHDVVALVEDRPDDGLWRGDVGAVVHCHRDHAAFEVEFIDDHGQTRCVATIPSTQLMKLNLLSLPA